MPESKLKASGQWFYAGLIGILLASFHLATIHDIDSKTSKSQALVAEAQDIIEQTFVKPVDQNRVAYSAIKGMVKELDRFSRFYDPKAAEIFRDDTRGSFGGIGIMVDTSSTNGIGVLVPILGAPAHQAGLMPGDVITAINKKPIEAGKIREMTDQLRGTPGSKVTLTVRSKTGPKTRAVEVTRAMIPLESIRHQSLLGKASKIGYFQIVNFQEDTLEGALKALVNLKRQGATAYIIDLRGNTGGLLHVATDIADAFLPINCLLVSLKRRNIIEYQEFAQTAQRFTAPVAVLIDSDSASASEVLAGALRDHQRAVLVGSRSYGKGSVQTVFDLSDGESVLKLTTAHYTTPSGRQIHRLANFKDSDEWGLIPDLKFNIDQETQLKLARHRAQQYIHELFKRLNQKPKAPLANIKDQVLDAAVSHLTKVTNNQTPLIPPPATPTKAAEPKQKPETSK